MSACILARAHLSASLVKERPRPTQSTSPKGGPKGRPPLTTPEGSRAQQIVAGHPHRGLLRMPSFAHGHRLQCSTQDRSWFTVSYALPGETGRGRTPIVSWETGAMKFNHVGIPTTTR